MPRRVLQKKAIKRRKNREKKVRQWERVDSEGRRRGEKTQKHVVARIAQLNSYDTGSRPVQFALLTLKLVRIYQHGTKVVHSPKKYRRDRRFVKSWRVEGDLYHSGDRQNQERAREIALGRAALLRKMTAEELAYLERRFKNTKTYTDWLALVRKGILELLATREEQFKADEQAREEKRAQLLTRYHHEFYPRRRLRTRSQFKPRIEPPYLVVYYRRRREEEAKRKGLILGVLPATPDGEPLDNGYNRLLDAHISRRHFRCFGGLEDIEIFEKRGFDEWVKWCLKHSYPLPPMRKKKRKPQELLPSSRRSPTR